MRIQRGYNEAKFKSPKWRISSELVFSKVVKKKKTELCVFIHSSIPRSSEDYHAVLIETKFLTLPSDMLMSHEEKIIKEENT